MFDNLKYLTIADRVVLFLIVPLLLTYVLVNLFSPDDSWPPLTESDPKPLSPPPVIDPPIVAEPVPLANEPNVRPPVHSDSPPTDDHTVSETNTEAPPNPRYWHGCMGEFHPTSMYFGSKAWKSTETTETPAIPNDKP